MNTTATIWDATGRIERLTRLIDNAHAHLIAVDVATMRRVATNLADYQAGRMTQPEAAGVFSVNVEELLEIIERLSRP